MTSSSSTSPAVDSTSSCPTKNSPSARLPKPLTDAFAAPARGWERLYVDSVLQADTGADLDFLVGSSGDAVSRESH